MQIGTLNEGALHAQLKEWYRRPGDLLEQVAGGFVVDLVRGDLLVEIQTGGFAPLRRKLELLTQEHPVRLVAPVPVGRRIVRLSDEGEVLSARRSPRRGRIEDIFSRLVSIPSLLCLPRFELEIVLTHQDELRVHRPGKAFRRRGWVVTGRRLVSVEERRRLATPADAAGLLPLALPELFDTAELAQAAGIERRLAQQMTYLLAGNGRARHCGQAERLRRPSARGVANGQVASQEANDGAIRTIGTLGRSTARRSAKRFGLIVPDLRAPAEASPSAAPQIAKGLQSARSQSRSPHTMQRGSTW